jgi:hypothetical protein
LARQIWPFAPLGDSPWGANSCDSIQRLVRRTPLAVPGIATQSRVALRPWLELGGDRSSVLFPEGITMSKRLVAACLLAIASSMPASADYVQLQLATSGFTGDHVTITVHNPSNLSVMACAQITVILDNGTSETILSPSFATAGHTTTAVTLTASRAIVGIGDDPQPVPE